MGFQGSLISSIVILFLDFVSSLNSSAHVAIIRVDNPGVRLIWKYNLASAICLSFGMGYFKINQLPNNEHE